MMIKINNLSLLKKIEQHNEKLKKDFEKRLPKLRAFLKDAFNLNDIEIDTYIRKHYEKLW